MIDSGVLDLRDRATHCCCSLKKLGLNQVGFLEEAPAEKGAARLETGCLLQARFEGMQVGCPEAAKAQPLRFELHRRALAKAAGVLWGGS